MKYLSQKYMRANLILVFLFIVAAQLNAQESAIDLPFKEIHYSIGRAYRGRLIDTYKEAVKIGLSKENKQEEQFYTTNAVFLFNVGGGCFSARPSQIAIKLTNNLVAINWDEPKQPCPRVGEASSFYAMIIINKKEYPNYKELKFKYYWE
ncbi:hypothetical protein Celal_0706 [Cellulophaga algicola DSM 14237]|uniref:Secreted protein n=1 Tax=Cellulophaga algicola (strain DSM 14237 / IC166 / ACAM 630) TaxID=688270 RepID=E6XDC8_CELAD|nr:MULTISPECIES: hypothetical protein [Cellulophaga]ADV48041.1 hypothetical protein Celal_0706 [Cellulophaga algicola DSM 14237]